MYGGAGGVGRTPGEIVETPLTDDGWTGSRVGRGGTAQTTVPPVFHELHYLSDEHRLTDDDLTADELTDADLTDDELTDDEENGTGNDNSSAEKQIDTDPMADTVDDEGVGDTDEERIRERLRELSRRARRDRRDFEPPADPPDEERAIRYLRDGVGQAIALYVHARTGGRFAHFDAEEFDTLEEAMNDWLSLYARCHGIELDASFSIRTAAEALIDTEDVRDVAYVLTGIPDR